MMKKSSVALAVSIAAIFSTHALAQENARLESVKAFADAVIAKASDKQHPDVPCWPMASIREPASSWSGSSRMAERRCCRTSLRSKILCACWSD